MSLPFRPADRLRNRNRSVWTIEDVARTEGPVLFEPVETDPRMPLVLLAVIALAVGGLILARWLVEGSL
ncbi:hypothetical protein [Magnetospirillum fulvum]|uniref:Uncharacterized protein n=1 Tax=Magnetospirillum fulvum MGU-K5 TaxID=1316936 RepID=S9SC95_MAGFU|nr:hypothetical protein [Magnetospirillum fulvum]EPY03512.1 hypothetical protein K678_00335 [Magnetospirillum fulvum MGU-K5]